MKAFQRILTLLLALILVVSSIPGVFAADEEEETDGDYGATDGYIYDHDVANNGYTGSLRQYFSFYTCQYKYEAEEGISEGVNPVLIYTLYNTVTGEVVPAYCTDILTGAGSGHSYRRLNLEDSTYASSGATRLRAIMLDGFYIPPVPGESMAEHDARADARLQELRNAVGIGDLTVSEAISGTQLAIWRVAHGPGLTYPLMVRAAYTYVNAATFRYYDYCYREKLDNHFQLDSYGNLTADSKAYLTERIKVVYDYLLSLPPVEADKKVASTASFKTLKESAPTLNDDGTYDLHLYGTVDVDMEEGDQLTLTAMADESHYTQVDLVDGEQKFTLTVEDVPADIAFNEVTLAIDGVQTLNEVFLFEAENGAKANQSMLGMDNSQVPVHALLRAKPKRDPIRIEKDVITLGNDSSTQDVNADHTWIIGTNVPDDMAEAKSFTIYDSMDTRLDYRGNMAVKLESVDGKETLITLEKDADYDLILVDGDGTAGESDAFKISLTPEGIQKIVAALKDKAYADYMIRVYFTARINANAEVAEDIPNQATAEYVNGNGLKYGAQSDIPIVYTGGANLLKVDALDQTKTLAGATFKVYRNATESEVAGNVEGLTHIEGVVPPVVPVSFYNNPDFMGEKVTEAVSGEDGKIAIYGLAYGTYYLVEKEAPEGYNLMQDIMELTIDGTSHLEENVVKVENVNGSTLPGTGGMGTALFTFFGVLLIGVAVVLLVVRKRMEGYEA